jgi:hypothetical protein
MNEVAQSVMEHEEIWVRSLPILPTMGGVRVMAHLLGDSDEMGSHCRVHEDETCHHVWVETDSFAGHEGGIVVPGGGEDGSRRVVIRLDGG